jgi:hypothetical protein
MWALVDAHNFHWLSQWNWYANLNAENGRWYAVRTIRLLNGRRVLQRMHRAIMGDPEGVEIDHEDRDETLNNRESNLRIATHAQNQQNCGLQINNTSGVKGVTWNKDKQKWHARIWADERQIHLGLFDTLLEAAQARNEAALKYHKEFAVLNDLSHVTEAQLEAA